MDYLYTGLYYSSQYLHIISIPCADSRSILISAWVSPASSLPGSGGLMVVVGEGGSVV